MCLAKSADLPADVNLGIINFDHGSFDLPRPTINICRHF